GTDAKQQAHARIGEAIWWHSDRIASRSPNCRRASAAAASGGQPASTSSRVRASIWNSTSSRRSRSISRPQKVRYRRHMGILRGIVSPPEQPRRLLRGGDDLGDRVGEPRPDRQFATQLCASCGGQFVVLRASIVLRQPPVGGYPPLALETMERRVEHTLLKLEGFLSDLSNPVGDAVTVHRSPAHCLQDEDVERPFENKQSVVSHRTPCCARVRLTPL